LKQCTLKRVAAWQTFSVSDRGNCNRVGNRIEIENLAHRFKISEPKLVLCTVREQSPSTAGLDDEKVFGAPDTEP
jgi:hypothetical protein